MPFSSLTRDKDVVLNALHETAEGSVLAKEPLKIVIPAWFEEVGLVAISSDVYTLGIFGIIVGDKYAANVVPANMRLEPESTEKVKYDGKDYYVFNFPKGSTVVTTTDLVKENTTGYFVYHNFIDLGKIPWYLNALNVLQLFEGTAEYTGVTYGDNHAATELIAAMIMRDSKELNAYWRQEVKSIKDVDNNPPRFISLRNVGLGAKTTTSKLMGSYFKEGLNSALINPSESTEVVEELLRQ